MFNTVEIERFRGIKHAKIENLKPINLFFGKNNCGKSSLLEAIFLASGGSNPVLPVYVNRIRDYNEIRPNDLKLDFYNLDSSEPIRIRMANREVRELKISLLEENVESVLLSTENKGEISNIANKKYGLQFDFSVGETTVHPQLLFDSDKSDMKLKLTKDYKEKINCAYLSPKSGFDVSLDVLQNIFLNKDEHFFLEGLKIIEPRVSNFTIAGNNLLVDVGLSQRIPINMLGDGARKIVYFIYSMYYCKDGLLLIDELSNGFHFSVMKSLWKILISAAKRNNTQLFITTHDIDSIKGLRDVAFGSKDLEDQIATFKLLRTKDDELETLHYSLASIDYAINQEIELR